VTRNLVLDSRICSTRESSRSILQCSLNRFTGMKSSRISAFSKAQHYFRFSETRSAANFLREQEAELLAYSDAHSYTSPVGLSFEDSDPRS